MIQAYDYIKHEKFMDVAFEVESAYDDGVHIIVSGYWMNQGNDKSWYCPVYKNGRDRAIGKLHLDSFKILKENLHQWSKVKIPPTSDCLRKCDWEAV
jgi:hypothetical protein